MRRKGLEAGALNAIGDEQLESWRVDFSLQAWEMGVKDGGRGPVDIRDLCLASMQLSAAGRPWRGQAVPRWASGLVGECAVLKALVKSSVFQGRSPA